MLSIDRLDQVRRVSRARAQEDFEFFANSVMGARLAVSLCETVQFAVEHEHEESYNVEPRVKKIVDAWLYVIGRTTVATIPPSETYAWLFGVAA